jgi:hypothetical protein
MFAMSGIAGYAVSRTLEYLLELALVAVLVADRRQFSVRRPASVEIRPGHYRVFLTADSWSPCFVLGYLGWNDRPFVECRRNLPRTDLLAGASSARRSIMMMSS